MSFLLKIDGKLVLRDGVLVTVPNASGNSSCECCADPCEDCSGTQSDVTSTRVGGAACGAGVTECNYANATLTFSGFSSDSTFCYWDFTATLAGGGKGLTAVYNHTASPQTYPVGCSVTVQPGEWYILLTVFNTGAGVSIRWNKNDAGVTCSGGELTFSESLTQCFNNWVGCGDCGTVTVSK